MHDKAEINIVSKIDFFGQDAAEQEDASDHLIHYFIQTDAFRNAAEGKKTTIIGRKGSGKSAIFLFLKRNKTTNTDLTQT